jgi:flagellar protein FliO/FliZ
VLELTVRLVVSLTIVVGLLLLLARFGSRKFRGNAGAMVRVVHRQPLSRTSAVAVVTVGTRVLVLGTTEQQVSVLAELEPDEIDLGNEDLLDDDVVLDFPDVELLEAPRLAAAPSAADSSAPSAPRPSPVRTPGAHRAAAPATRPAVPAAGGVLVGSVLSPQTSRQALAAVSGRGGRPARRAS